MAASEGLSIGEIAARTGLAVSAIRYYEDEGLVAPWRNAGGQRRFQRADIEAAELHHGGAAIQAVHPGPDQGGTGSVAAPPCPEQAGLGTYQCGISGRSSDERIARLEKLRDTLDGCIGCGCLSLEVCALYNPKDTAADKGQGPRYLMGDTPP